MRKLKIFTTNLLKQFMGKVKHEYLLALQERHSCDRKVKSSDCYLFKNWWCVIVKRRNITTIILEKGTGHRANATMPSLEVHLWKFTKESDKAFILKWPLQHLDLLETTIKDPTNEIQSCCREAAMNAGAIRKLTTWLCYDPNPGGSVSIIQNLYIYVIFTF